MIGGVVSEKRMTTEETKAQARECHRIAIEHLPDLIKGSSRIATEENVLRGKRFRIHTRLTNEQRGEIGQVETNADLETGEVRPSLVRYEFLP